jgi:Terpene synthase family 2, C-terminal metal binding
VDAFVLPAFYLPYPGMLAEGLWNERRLAGFDFARLLRRDDPHGGGPRTAIALDRLAHLGNVRGRLLRGHVRGQAGRGRREGVRRTARGRELVRDAVLDMIGSWVWEVGNLAINRIPDPVDYVEMRRKTFGADLAMSLAQLGDADALPRETLPPEIGATRIPATT